MLRSAAAARFASLASIRGQAAPHVAHDTGNLAQNSSGEDAARHADTRRKLKVAARRLVQMAGDAWRREHGLTPASLGRAVRHRFLDRVLAETGLDAAQQLLSSPQQLEAVLIAQLRAADARASAAALHESEAAAVDSAELALLTDLREPHTWFGLARSLRRKVVFHAGPTNSGKTHAALAALRSHPSGVYCAPLRLLAQEVHERMRLAGVPCSLVTGEQRIIDPLARHTACTVEMAVGTLRTPLACAVLDEIQMIGDPDRGWAWTQALLALPAAEVHVVGEPRAIELVRTLCTRAGDEFSLIQYERLCELSVESRALGAIPRGLAGVRPGDAVIAFSRARVHALAASIERKTRLRCALIYGSLPPEVRRRQVAAFGTAAEVLVATDAIGMGLNLSVRRVVLSETTKYDGERSRALTATEIKQVAGRAGRYGSRFAEGFVTCFQPSDLRYVADSLALPYAPISKAGLFPSADQLEALAAALPGVSFVGVVRAMQRAAQLDGSYFLTRFDDFLAVARLIDGLALTTRERYTFCSAPVDTNSASARAALRRFAAYYASGESVPVSVSDRIPMTTTGHLHEAEEAFRVCDLYMWLAMRYETAFAERERALALKQAYADAITAGLARFSRLREERPRADRDGGRSRGRGRKPARGRL